LVYADDVNILRGGIHTVKKNAWSFLEIRMQEEITIYRLVKVLLEGWGILNIWEQP
jgi:hypothetical protein